jgi:uncharacterized protein (DUF2235 family)
MARRIILLSDGTGNSAGKLAKTNVWRTYQALDLASGDQIAMYDDGVGTSSVKFLAAIGGAFGWGLKRNVLALYKFICRNYRTGDEIYAFGFSRGAFTIRVLMGLLLTQGVVRWYSEEELDLLAKEAYRAYRAERYRRKASLSQVGRWIRNGMVAIRNRLLGLKPYTKAKNVEVERVAFLGLWDTVDAYGVPIKELKAGIDRFIWPLYFDNRKLNPKVELACHALALDDERATFHPLVWDESEEDPRKKRIHQKWFAGVHSNVGGGYPDDALAHVPLLWVLGHAVDAGLQLKQGTMDQYGFAASPYGRMYDSRSGLSSYYRYAPRKVEAYSARPEVHESVYLRIANGSDQYAPISLPVPAQCEDAYDLTWDTVWWRRVAYWVMVALTVGLLSLMWKAWPLGDLDDAASTVTGWLVSAAKAATPEMLAPGLNMLLESAAMTLIFLVAIVATFMWGRILEGRIHDRADGIWKVRTIGNQVMWNKQSKERWRALTSLAVVLAALGFAAALCFGAEMRWRIGTGIAFVAAVTLLFARRKFDADRESRPAQASRGWGLRFAHAIRTSTGLTWLWERLTNNVIPFLFAMVLLLSGVLVLNRVGFGLLNAGGAVCKSRAPATALAPGEEKVVVFATNDPCFATGVRLEEGVKYRIEITPTLPWKDDRIDVHSLDGFSSRDPAAPWYMGLATPLRRNMSDKWFKPFARIGRLSPTDRPLGKVTELDDLGRSGELFLFVNDAVIGLPWMWDRFYANNQGQARVVIRRVEETAVR